jgi:aldose 1-epimerase
MMDKRRIWGEGVEEVEIVSPGGARANILSWGAALRDMHVRLRNGKEQRVLLGFESFEPYPKHSPYFGSIAGRVANRISGAQFVLDGRTYTLPANENGHCLHGGPNAMGMQPWTFLEGTASSATLAYLARDGENGFPGNLAILCTYRFEGEADLVCALSATTDAPTLVNLAQHNYYNLDGSADIGGHLMQVHADSYTPTDAELIPTGEIRSVKGTAYDFSNPKALRLDTSSGRFGFDCNFVLAGGGQNGLALAASVTSPVNGLALDVLTDQPGLQFYDGSYLKVAVPGLGGALYGAHAGFCLEPQKFPDAPNRPRFPSIELRPGEIYRQTSIFRFRAG